MAYWRPHLKSKRITDFFGRKARFRWVNWMEVEGFLGFLSSSKMIFEEVVNLEFIQKVWVKMKNHDWWIKWCSHFWIAPLSFVNPFPKSLIPSLTWWKLQGFGNVRGILVESTVHFFGGCLQNPLKLKSRCLLEVRTPEITSFNHSRHVWNSLLSRIHLHWNVKPLPCDATKKSFTTLCRGADVQLWRVASCTEGWYMYI